MKNSTRILSGHFQNSGIKDYFRASFRIFKASWHNSIKQPIMDRNKKHSMNIGAVPSNPSRRQPIQRNRKETTTRTNPHADNRMILRNDAESA